MTLKSPGSQSKNAKCGETLKSLDFQCFFLLFCHYLAPSYRYLYCVTFRVQHCAFIITVSGSPGAVNTAEPVIDHTLCRLIDLFFATDRDGNMGVAEIICSPSRRDEIWFRHYFQRRPGVEEKKITRKRFVGIVVFFSGLRAEILFKEVLSPFEVADI